MSPGNSVLNEETKTSDSVSMRLSLPLYLGGLVVTLCGVEAVCSSMGAASITVTATALCLFGFMFSMACRVLKVQPRVIEVACVALIGFLLFQWNVQHVVFGQDLTWYVQGADKAEDRVAAGLMWSAVFWSWTLVSSDSVMFSCVLTAAMIGLTGSVNVNNSTLVYFCLFVLAMTFLLIHQNYLLNRALASARERARTAPVFWAQAGLASVCGVFVLCVGVVLVVPMRAVLSSLSLSQAIRQFVGSRGIANPGLSLIAERFSDGTGLEIGRGSAWPTSPSIVMHVHPSDHQPHYLRGRTYDFYTGKGWQSTRQNPTELEWQEASDDGHWYNIPVAWIQGEGRKLNAATLRSRLTMQVDVKGDTDQFYYPDEPRRLLYDTDDEVSLRLASDGSLDLSGRPVRTPYAVASAAPPDPANLAVQAHLRGDGTVYSPLVRRLYLGPLQNGLTTSADTAYFRSAVRAAVRGLPPGHQTPVDTALALQAWITHHCTYSLSVDPLPGHQDHVRAFLADTRRGYCDLFASSMVVLCRTAGIPARLATGFAPGDPDDTGFNIRAMDKHAWAEVYFPGDGWLIFDPTVGSHTDGTIPTSGSAHISAWRRLQQWYTVNGPLAAGIAAAIVLCLAFVASNELGGRSKSKKADKGRKQPVSDRALTELGRSYASMTGALAGLGLPRRPAETPAEYEARVVPLLAQRAALLGVPLPEGDIHLLTNQFIAARYGGAQIGDPRQAARLAARIAHMVSRARFVQWRQGFWSSRPPFPKNA